MSTQILHTSYTERTGYVWRQRYAGSALSITLKTKDEKEVAQRSGVMWVLFAVERRTYSVMQGKLKSTVHSVMIQFGFVSSWRG